MHSVSTFLQKPLASMPLAGSVFALATLALSLTGSSQAPFLPPPPAAVSTVPANGDLNPYGTVFVHLGYDNRDNFANAILKAGDLLVSNFNNKANLQGTGTTIVRVGPHGKQALFFQGATKYAGLSGALGILSNGIVVVGNLEAVDGTSATAKPGALQFISPAGKLLNVVTGTEIDGPWGLAIAEHTDYVNIWVSNVLSGTIVRLQLNHPHPTGPMVLQSATVITKGLAHRGDPAALELGPSGLLYDAATDTLYLASSLENAIYTIDKASTVGADDGTPKLLVQDTTHLHGPLDLAFTPNGHILVANSDGSNVNPEAPSEITEYTAAGVFVAQFSVDPNNGGAFGIATQTSGVITRFAAVDDDQNNVTTYAEVYP